MPNNATMTSPTYATGKFGQGLSAGYGVAADLSSSSAVTVEAWAKTTGSVLQIIAGQSGLFWFGVNSAGKPTARYGGGSGGVGEVTLESTGAAVNDNALHHFAIVFGPSGGAYYVDGVQVASSATTLAASNAVFNSVGLGLQLRHFGSVPGDYIWQGLVDEITAWTTARYTTTFTPPTSAYVGNEAGLTRLYHLDGNGTDDQGTAPAYQTIARNNAAVTYSPYSWNDDGTSANANSTGSYASVTFTGTSFGFTTVALTGLTDYPVVRVFLDNAAPIDVQLASGTTSYTVSTGLAAGTHTARLVLLRMNEEAGWWSLANALKIVSYQIDTAATVSATTPRSKKMLWFGDSITQSVFVLGNLAGNDGQDATVTVPAMLAEALDAEIGTIGYGGQGFANTGSGGVPSFNSAYNLYSSGVSRLSSGAFSPAPDYVVCWHGTNGTPSQANVATAITNLRTAAPNALIFMVVPPGGFRRTEITAATNAAITAGDTKLFLIDAGSGSLQAGLSGAGASFSSSDGVHPYALANARLAAEYATQIQHAIEPRRFTVIAA